MRVYIERDRTRLRIRIIYKGRKYQFSTGLTDEYRTQFHIAQSWGIHEASVCRIVRMKRVCVGLCAKSKTI